MLSYIRTKRYMFYTLMKHINRVESLAKENNGVFQNGCVSLVGVRGVGKTTLLLQLYDEAPEISEYVDISKLPKGFNFQEFFRAKYDAGVRRIYLDEICKINEDDKADLISNIKICASVMFFVCTGSTRGAVIEMNSLIGRGIYYNLTPITYAERLAWSAGVELSDNPDFMSLSSMDKFNSYLNFGGLNLEGNSEESYLRYVGSIVEDTLQSFLRRYDSLGTMPEEKFNLILRYISLCQHIYKVGHNKFCDIPSLTHEVQNELGRVYQKIKGREGVSSEDIKLVCSVLQDSGLGKRAYFLSEYSVVNEYTERQLMTLTQIDENVPSFIFEFPRYASFALTPLLSNDNVLRGKWVEDLILLKMSYVYEFVDKYREQNSDELDMVYETVGAPRRLHGIEIKNRKSYRVSQSDVERYISFARQLGLKSLCITCTDKHNTVADGSSSDFEVRFFRVDYVVLALELEYISLINAVADDISRSIFGMDSVQDILSKFGFCD